MDNKYYHSKAILKRRIGKRPLRPLILITCEGCKTEKNYFESFRLATSRIKIIIKGAGESTIKLVRGTLKIQKYIENEMKEHFDQVWCVFDKDNSKDLNNAIKYARKNNINVCYSNQAFEVWFLLHFDLFTNPMSPKELHKKLDTKMQRQFNQRYLKNYENMYDLLESSKNKAIINAKNLLRHHRSLGKINPEMNSPSTTVFLLVEELNKYI